MDFRAVGWVLIVLGTPLVALGLFEQFVRFRGLPRHFGWWQALSGMGLALQGTSYLNRTSFSGPTTWWGWAGILCMGVAGLGAWVSALRQRAQTRELQKQSLDRPTAQ